jgi:thiamine kinase-like enzyme
MPLEDDLPWDTTFAGASGSERVVGHNDVCPENTLFRSGRAVAFIDFDFAAPTDPVLDLAHLLRMWVPLGIAAGPDRAERHATRMRCATNAYGVEPGRELQDALELSVSQAETFVRTQLNRADLTTEYFAQRRTELIAAASAR